jgi:hypothetical protein
MDNQGFISLELLKQTVFQRPTKYWMKNWDLPRRMCINKSFIF